MIIFKYRHVDLARPHPLGRNLDSLNAVLIRQGLQQPERLAALNGVAISQLTSLANHRSVQKLK